MTNSNVHPERGRRSGPSASVDWTTVVIGVTAITTLAAALGFSLLWTSSEHNPSRQTTVTFRLYVHDEPLDAWLAPHDPNWIGRDAYIDLQVTDVEFYDSAGWTLVLTPAATQRLAAAIQWQPLMGYRDNAEIASNLISVNVMINGTMCLRMGALNQTGIRPADMSKAFGTVVLMRRRSGLQAAMSFAVDTWSSIDQLADFPYEEPFERVPRRLSRPAVNASRCDPPWPDSDQYRRALRLFGSVMQAAGLVLRRAAP